jgi:folate-binding Fe-S cluster repair protein YgfZ
MSVNEELKRDDERFHSGQAYVDVSLRTKIELRGADRATFLNNFCTADIRHLPCGAGTEAFFCNAKGAILGFGYVFACDDSLWIDTEPGQAAQLISHFDRYIIREDVALGDRTSEFAALLLKGLPAIERLEQLLHCKLPRLSGKHATIPRQSFLAALLQSGRASCAGIPAGAAPDRGNG